ncbi:MAG: ribosome recycling factor [Candidatus Gracilibacteria bacterium]|nr:ribosome recycling factor [Candidatus Gracilibacteria bacterium]
MLHTLEADLKKAEQHLHDEFAKLQVGRANPAIVEGIMVMVYGSAQPLRNVASVGTLDAQTISIQPWDRSVLRDISKAINDANIGLNPQDNGESVLIRIPALTEERRRDLVKIAKKLAEDGKVAIRNIRQDYLKKIKGQDESVGEDIVKQQEKDLQKNIDEAIVLIDKMLKHKEEEIMKI